MQLGLSVCVPLRRQEAEEPIGGGLSPEQMLPTQSHSARMCIESVRLLIRIWVKKHFSRAPCKDQVRKWLGGVGLIPLHLDVVDETEWAPVSCHLVVESIGCNVRHP